jgi:hypothetical protein
MGFSVNVSTIDTGRMGVWVTVTAGVTAILLFSLEHPAVNRTATSKRTNKKDFISPLLI